MLPKGSKLSSDNKPADLKIMSYTRSLWVYDINLILPEQRGCLGRTVHVRSGSGRRRDGRRMVLEGVPKPASSQAAAADWVSERHSQKSS